MSNTTLAYQEVSHNYFILTDEMDFIRRQSLSGSEVAHWTQTALIWLKAWVPHLLSVWPLKSQLSSLCLDFLIYKTGINNFSCLTGLLWVLDKISGTLYGSWHIVSKHSISYVLLKFVRKKVSWKVGHDQIIDRSVCGNLASSFKQWETFEFYFRSRRNTHTNVLSAWRQNGDTVSKELSREAAWLAAMLNQSRSRYPSRELFLNNFTPNTSFSFSPEISFIKATILYFFRSYLMMINFIHIFLSLDD